MFTGISGSWISRRASTMTEAVKGKSVDEARAYFEAFLKMAKGELPP